MESDEPESPHPASTDAHITAARAAAARRRGLVPPCNEGVRPTPNTIRNELAELTELTVPSSLSDLKVAGHTTHGSLRRLVDD
ncbi:hypothetical protein E0500_005625 [Streptomyces sp. KM273126]|uniref:hypothetical protein n=1 Tax=Streptomyces sp. KM273126 TaxID=2545247 RepID=UPI001404BF71|nr:hypothetical protein [Streptomyces sp. KM273126]MBA2806935.1 hypothetical protein [Streptomyces sp. KM273126]